MLSSEDRHTQHTQITPGSKCTALQSQLRQEAGFWRTTSIRQEWASLGLFIEPGHVETSQGPPCPSFSQSLTHHRQPRGHHTADLNTTRAHLGKQPPFLLTCGCPMGGWVAGWHWTHVRVLGSSDIDTQTNRTLQALQLSPRLGRGGQQKSHPLERLASQRSHPTYHLSGEGGPFECGAKLGVRTHALMQKHIHTLARTTCLHSGKPQTPPHTHTHPQHS